MAFDPIGAGIGLTPLVGEQLAAFRKRNEVRNAFQEIDRAVRRSDAVLPGKHDLVREKVAYLNVDPTFMGYLQAYLDRADIDVVPAMRDRLEQLLKFADPEISDPAVVELVISSIRENAHRAKRDVRETTHFEGQLTRAPLRPSFVHSGKNSANEIHASLAP